jgi:hypothetical protein
MGRLKRRQERLSAQTSAVHSAGGGSSRRQFGQPQMQHAADCSSREPRAEHETGVATLQ